MNRISKMIKDERDINYEMLKQIQEHAKEYETTPDKKEFLKNVGAYEQKLILLNSTHPYEVLCYMEELDLPTTKLILSELNYDEISKVLGLFTTEDKNAFYTTFSDLELVNQFIAYDKKAEEYIENLSVDRKIDLLNSSDLETSLASSKVLNTVSDEDKSKVVSSVNTVDGMIALSSADTYNEVVSPVKNNENENIVQDKQSLEVKEETMKENEQKVEKAEENKLEVDPEFDAKMNYFKDNFEKYKETNPELNNVDINAPDFHKLIGAALLVAISRDFENYKKFNIENKTLQKEQVDEVELTETSKLEKFKESQKQNEVELLQNIQAQLDSKPLELKPDSVVAQLDSIPVEVEEENIKTL